MIVTAIVAGVCSSFANESADGIGEAICICLMALCMWLISAAADYCKDKRFLKLQELVAEEDCTVVRGKYGSSVRQSVWDLVVGDIVLLSQGDLVPAHCVLIESAHLKVDEVDAKETQRIAKSEDRDGQSSSDPFLKCGSLVTDGECRALVCCVGANARDDEGTPQSIQDQLDGDTPLQEKMKKIDQPVVAWRSRLRYHPPH